MNFWSKFYQAVFVKTVIKLECFCQTRFGHLDDKLKVKNQLEKLGILSLVCLPYFSRVAELLCSRFSHGELNALKNTLHCLNAWKTQHYYSCHYTVDVCCCWSMREFSLPLVATPELWRKYDLEAKPQFKSLEEPNQFHYSSKIHFACFWWFNLIPFTHGSLFLLKNSRVVGSLKLIYKVWTLTLWFIIER